MKQNTTYPAQATEIPHKSHLAWRAAGATLLGTLMLLGATHAQEQRPAAGGPPDIKAKAVSPAQAAVEKKLDAIMFPPMDFQGVSLIEAVDALRSCAKEQDTSTVDPAKRGINFMIRAPRDFRPGSVEIKLEKMTLRKALENIAEASGTRFHVDETGVTVLPKDAPLPPKPGDPAAIKQAALKIMIPVINFEDTPIGEAVAFLNQQLKEHSVGEPAFTLSIDADKVDSTLLIKELRLKNVSAHEALTYFSRATQLTLTAGDKVVWVTRR